MTFTHGKTTDHRAILAGPDGRVRYFIESRSRKTVRLAAARWTLRTGDTVYFARQRKGVWAKTGKARYG